MVVVVVVVVGLILWFALFGGGARSAARAQNVFHCLHPFVSILFAAAHQMQGFACAQHTTPQSRGESRLQTTRKPVCCVVLHTYRWFEW